MSIRLSVTARLSPRGGVPVVPSHRDEPSGCQRSDRGRRPPSFRRPPQLCPRSRTLPCPPAVAEARRLPRLIKAADHATTGGGWRPWTQRRSARYGARSPRAGGRQWTAWLGDTMLALHRAANPAGRRGAGPHGLQRPTAPGDGELAARLHLLANPRRFRCSPPMEPWVPAEEPSVRLNSPSGR